MRHALIFRDNGSWDALLLISANLARMSMRLCKFGMPEIVAARAAFRLSDLFLTVVTAPGHFPVELWCYCWACSCSLRA